MSLTGDRSCVTGVNELYYYLNSCLGINVTVSTQKFCSTIDKGDIIQVNFLNSNENEYGHSVFVDSVLTNDYFVRYHSENKKGNFSILFDNPGFHNRFIYLPDSP